MYCSQCGKKNNDSNIYCNYCGTKLQLDTNKITENKFVVENNTIEDIKVRLILIITCYVVSTIFMGSGIFDCSFPINLIILAYLALFTCVVVFFLYYSVRKLKAGKYSLIIDKNGITDYYSATALGFIPWNDIQDIYISKNNKVKNISNRNILKIKLKDEDKYLNKVCIIPRIIMLIYKKLGLETIQIPLAEREPLETLLQELKKDSKTTNNIKQVNSNNDNNNEIISNYIKEHNMPSPRAFGTFVIAFILVVILLTFIARPTIPFDIDDKSNYGSSKSSSSNNSSMYNFYENSITVADWNSITVGRTTYNQVISTLGSPSVTLDYPNGFGYRAYPLTVLSYYVENQYLNIIIENSSNVVVEKSNWK